MKNRIVLMVIIVLLLIAVLVGLFIIKKRKKVVINEIKSMYFSYTNGYMVNSNVYYEIKLKDDKYIAAIKPNEVAEEDKLEIEVDKSTVNKIKKVLKENKVEKWNGFDKSNRNVMDGDSFSFNLETNSGKINAHGYMKWPKNYSKVCNSLDNIFMDIYNNNKKDK